MVLHEIGILVNEIKYFDWKEHHSEYLDILKSLVDTGAEQFSIAYLENIPNWVYSTLMKILFSILSSRC